MTTYVQVCEDDPAFDLHQLVTQISGLPANPSDEKEIKDGNYLGLFQKCFGCKDKILQDQQLISTTFSLLLSLLQLVHSEHSNGLITQMTNILVQDHNHSRLRIELLTNLFNLVGDGSPCRSHVFRHILRYALDTGNADLLVGKLEFIDKWVIIWKLDKQQTQEFFLLASKVSRAGKDSKDAQSYRLKYLRLFDDDDRKQIYDDETIEEASEAVLSAVKFTHRMDDMLEIAAIQNLQNKKPELYSLLEIFASGTVNDLEQFQKEDPDRLRSIGLDEAFCYDKMRTLTICSLGTKQEFISYETLKKELKVEKDMDVEIAVVNSVRSGLIDAKINQQERHVVIQKTMERVFTDRSWEELQKKLFTWKENTRSILHTLHQVRTQHRK